MEESGIDISIPSRLMTDHRHALLICYLRVYYLAALRQLTIKIDVEIVFRTLHMFGFTYLLAFSMQIHSPH